MALQKRIRRTLAENKGRYIGVFILIFLGSFAFVWFRGFSGNYGRLVNDFAARNLQEDVSFSSRLPIGDLAALERDSGAAIEAYRTCDVALDGGRELRLITPGEKVNIPAVLEGRNLENPGEILLSPNYFSLQGYSLGDVVQAGDRSYTVVGTVALPHYVYPLKYVNDITPPPGFGLGVVTAEALDAYPEAQTLYAARFARRDNLSGQVKGLYSLLEQEGHSLTEWVDATTNKRIRMAWATISGMEAMSIPVPAVMFLLCCLIVGLLIWRMVRADGVIIGTLYAQGYRRRELLLHYLTIPLCIAAAAGVAGVLLALPTINPTVEMMAELYYVIPCEGASVSAPDVALGVLLPTLSLGLACWLVVRRELKKTPAELMKGDRKKAKVNPLERSLRLERLSFSSKFKVREQIRSIPRLLFLLLGITAATFLMLIGFTINHSMSTVFNGSTQEPMNYAWEYSFKEARQGQPPEGAVPFNAIRCHPEGREAAEFYLNGIPTDADPVYDLVDAQGNPLPLDQVNITTLLANRLKLGVGDSLHMVGKLDGRPYSLVIDGIAQTYSGQFVYLPLEQFNAMTGQPADAYTGVFSNETLPYGPEELAGVKDLLNMTDAMDDLMGPMLMMVVGMTAVAALIGVIIIFLVTSLIIEENRSSISLLKVFGYRSREVKSLVLGGSGVIVVAGFLLGIPIMLASANGLYAYLGEMINLALPMLLSPLYVAVSFVLICGVYQLTKLWCGRRLEDIPMGEALKSLAE